MGGDGTEGTTTIYQYWSGEIGDNYLTTEEVTDGNYELADDTLNPAGLVFKDKPTWLHANDTVALQVWYSAAKGDHLTIATVDSIAWAQANGYALLDEAIGYVFTEPQPDAALEARWTPQDLLALI